MSVELRGRRGVVGHLSGLQAQAVTVAAVVLLLALAIFALVTVVAALKLLLKVAV